MRDPAGRRAAAPAGQPHHADEPRPHAAAALLVPAARREGRRRHDRRRPRPRTAPRAVRPLRGGEPGRVARWRTGSACARRPTSIPSTAITDAQARAFQADGFEIALHLSTGCADFTPASLADDWETQLPRVRRRLARPRRPARPTARTASPGATGPASRRSSASHGVRLDTNYYYWPGAWVQDRPGMFTGSGFPMRFADADGSLIDVYQAATQLTDESEIDIDRHIQTLLDGALGLGRLLRRLHGQHAHRRRRQPRRRRHRGRGPGARRARRLRRPDARLARRPQRLVVRGPQLRRRPAALQRGPRRRRARPRGDDPGDRRDRRPVPADAQRHARAGDRGAPSRASTTACSTPPRAPTWRPTARATTRRPTRRSAPRRSAATAPPSRSRPTSPARSSSAASTAARSTPCDSPAHFNGLPDGSHTLAVRAIDLAGNVDPTPASTSFVTAGTPAGHHPAGHDDRRRDRHRQPRAPDLLLQRRRRALPVPARRRRLRRLHEPRRLQRARRRRAHVPRPGDRRRGQRRSDPGDAHLHHAGRRIDIGHDLPGRQLADPGRRRRVVAGRARRRSTARRRA